jgi:hypothetical protein
MYYEYFEKQTQKIKEVGDYYKKIFIYANIQNIAYIKFYIVETKALIYLKDKSVPFFLFHINNFIHCRSPPTD